MWKKIGLRKARETAKVEAIALKGLWAGVVEDEYSNAIIDATS